MLCLVYPLIYNSSNEADVLHILEGLPCPSRTLIHEPSAIAYWFGASSAIHTPAFDRSRKFSFTVLGVPYAASPVFTYISSSIT